MIILQSIAPPDGTTRYVDQLVDSAPADVHHRFFTWAVAFLGKYDIFHVHWPEQLIRGSSPIATSLRHFALRILLRWIAFRKIPIVRTIHNSTPHEDGGQREAQILRRINDETSLFIRLNSSTPPVSPAPVVTILHGHYRDRFRAYRRGEAQSHRALHFGLIRPYKGVDRLLTEFHAVPDVSAQLRLVGKATPELAGLIEAACAGDPRVSSRLEFVPDADLVEEVTSSSVVLIPYTELENSGVALVALSLSRPILAPDTPSMRALRDEVGADWVILYRGALESGDIRDALSRALPAGEPELHGRDWEQVGRQHRNAYRQALEAAKQSRGRSAHVYLSAVGQGDNLGDSVLRRVHLDGMRRLGRLHVDIQGMHDDYVSGLGLSADDTVYSSRRSWWISLWASAFRSRTVIAFNAGEMQATITYALSYLLRMCLGVLIRVRGGGLVHLGLGIRSRTRWAKVLGFLLSGAAAVSWRDESSRKWTGVGELMPDWAFAIEGTPTSSRDILAISVRGDRGAPSADWLQNVERFIAQSGLTPVVVVQARRDMELATQLGRRWSCEVAEWHDASHALHEKVVRGIYSRSRAVLGDRLHALIIGATEGAVPMGYASAKLDKLARTLDAAGMGQFVVDQTRSTPVVEQLWEMLGRRRELDEAVRRSRRELAVTVDKTVRAFTMRHAT